MKVSVKILHEIVNPKPLTEVHEFLDLGPEPIRVPRETGKPEIEIFRSRVEQALNKLNNDFDRACGWSPDGSRNYARSGRERSVPEEKD